MNRSSTIIESVDADQLIDAIAAAVMDRLAPLLNSTANGTTDRCVSRRRLTEIVPVSESTVDRMRESGMPSIMVGSNRLFILDEVLKWMKEQTPGAEAAAIARQAAKNAAKHAAQAERQKKASR